VSSSDGLVRVFNLFDYVQPRVTRDEPGQHPVFKGDVENNFAIALNRAGTKTALPDGPRFLYDAYLSYVDRSRDSDWVNGVLAPRLRDAGLRIAQSGDVEQPGVDRLVGIARGIQSCKRIVTVLSNDYLRDAFSGFESDSANFEGVSEGSYRLLPISFEPLNAGLVPLSIRRLTRLDFSDPIRVEQSFSRLITALHGPLPTHFQ
jgi:TIR domain